MDKNYTIIPYTTEGFVVAKYVPTSTITRLEVIDQTGRVLVKYLNPDEALDISIQDDGRTMKVFIDSNLDDKVKKAAEVLGDW